MALARLRRSFHTLKGSGRMVGARQIGEFAWAIENLLNRIISGTLSRTPGMLNMLRESVAMLPQLVDQLETGRAPPAEAGLLIGRAHAFAEGRDVEQGMPARPEPVARKPAPPPEPLFAPPPDPYHPDAPSLIATEVLMTNDPAVPTPAPPRSPNAPKAAPKAAEPAAAPPPPKSAAKPQKAASDTTGAVLEVPSRFVRITDEVEAKPEKESRAAPPPPPSGSEFIRAPDDLTGATADPVLVDIYRGEVSSHVVAVRQFVDACAGRFAPFAVTEALHRACHTLAGASKMADARHGIKLAEPLNLYVRKLYDHGLGLSEAGRRVIADIVAAMDDVASHFAESTQYFTSHAELLSRLAWLDADANREISKRGLTPGQEGADASGYPGGAADLLALGDMLEAPVTPTPARAATPAMPPRAPPRAAAADADGGDDFDAEIAVIFSEEATELLEIAERQFAAFRTEARDASKVTELKRVLHTLKGGARMAGVTVMGDLAHEVESLLTQGEVDGTTGDPRTLEVLQVSLDELNRMRDTVSALGGASCRPATS